MAKSRRKGLNEKKNNKHFVGFQLYRRLEASVCVFQNQYYQINVISDDKDYFHSDVRCFDKLYKIGFCLITLLLLHDAYILNRK